MNILDAPLWLVGAGNMGGAMLRGWIAAGVDPGLITVIDPGASGLPEGVTHVQAPPPDGATPAILILAVKPQLLDVAAPPLAPMLAAETLLVSVLAGVEIASLRARLPLPRGVIRVMPNTPAAIGKGVFAMHGIGLDHAATAQAERLMRAIGTPEWIAEESLFDAVTALSGCGPAFLFRFVDALARAGASIGLPADQAARLALATVEGSAMLAAQSADSPAALADKVASPGGSTREGLNVLDRDEALFTLMQDTLRAAARRNAELAAAARG